MTIKEFFEKYNGQFVDFDKYYGYQCVDLYRKFCEEVLDVDEQSRGVTGAFQIWTTFKTADFEKIKNTPSGVPELGDIVVWDKSATLGYGHVAIFNYGDVNSFISFDQNWPVGSNCHFQNHNYSGVLGWLRPKGMDFSQVQITDQTKIDMGEPWGVMEVQAIRSTLNDQKRTIESLESALSEKDDKWQLDMESAKEEYKKLELELEKCNLRKVDHMEWWELCPLTWKKMIKWARGVIPK